MLELFYDRFTNSVSVNKNRLIQYGTLAFGGSRADPADPILVGSHSTAVDDLGVTYVLLGTLDELRRWPSHLTIGLLKLALRTVDNKPTSDMN